MRLILTYFKSTLLVPKVIKMSTHDEENITNKIKLLIMFSLTFLFFLVEIFVGYYTNSVALVADSFHMFSDLAALLVAYFSVKMAPKKWSKNTYGWARAEVLGAMVNSVLLVALCFSILVESINRFLFAENIEKPQLILIVGILGLVVNLIGLCIFRQSHSHGHSHGGGGHVHSHFNFQNNHNHSHEGEPEKGKKSVTTLVHTQESGDSLKISLQENHESKVEETDKLKSELQKDGSKEVIDKTSKTDSISASQMNMHGVFLHLLGDALGSVIVVISALIIWLTDWKYRMYVDPMLSILMVFIIIFSALPLLNASIQILLQNVPAHIQVDELERKLVQEIDEIIDVHDFHIWQLAGDRIIATAHIRCRNVNEYVQIAQKIKTFFHREGIHSTTIQPEYTEEQGKNLNYERPPYCSSSTPKFLTND